MLRATILEGALVLFVICLSACSDGPKGPGPVGVTKNGRTVLAKIELAGTAGSLAEECLVSYRDYEPSENCIQRVRMEATGEERVELSPGPCPNDGPSSAVALSLALRTVIAGQAKQLFDTRPNAVTTLSVGSVSSSDQLENLCSGAIYRGRCDVQIVDHRWGTLVPYPSGSTPCP